MTFGVKCDTKNKIMRKLRKENLVYFCWINKTMTTVYYAGDSTVQYNDATTYPQTGIGQVLHLFLKKDVNVSNHAKNGRSTKSFMDECRLVPIYDNITKGDFLFIQFGHNDEKENDPLRYTEPYGEFRDNLQRMCNLAHNKGAIPVIISPIERRLFNEDGSLRVTHEPYVSSMREFAKEQNIAFIDLNKMSREILINLGAEEAKKLHLHLKQGEYKNFKDGLSDNTHLKYEGAVTYAECIVKGLYELGGVFRDLLVEGLFDNVVDALSKVEVNG